MLTVTPAAPVVLSQSQTINDAMSIVTRQRNVMASGFDVRVQEEQAQDGVHAEETIGYIAIQAGIGSTGDLAFEAGGRVDL